MIEKNYWKPHFQDQIPLKVSFFFQKKSFIWLHWVLALGSLVVAD